MSTHPLKLSGRTTERPPISAPVRALGALERRRAPRRAHPAPGRTTSRADGARSAPNSAQPVLWLGDERETTQGDW